MAVEAKKFFAIGGFDEDRLPVELSDVDLCLRLAERGWRSRCLGSASIIHHESATRRPTLQPDVRYRNERLYFRDRWIDAIRDDPYFHPSLSLDSLRAALG